MQCDEVMRGEDHDPIPPLWSPAVRAWEVLEGGQATVGTEGDDRPARSRGQALMRVAVVVVVVLVLVVVVNEHVRSKSARGRLES